MNFIQCGRDRFILNKMDVYFDLDINSLKYKTRFEELDSEPIQCVIDNIDELENYFFGLPIDELIIVGNQTGKQLEFCGEIRKIRFVNSLDEVQLPEVFSEHKMKDWD